VGSRAVPASEGSAHRAKAPVHGTTSNETENREKWLAAGANEYAEKPLDLEALLATLARWTKKKMVANTGQFAAIGQDPASETPP
jgi:CheY-like chemotaxis protein